MSNLFEANWAAVKEALLNEEPSTAAGRKTIPWLEENTRRNTMQATIYSKPNCPFCVRAKMLLQSKGVEITEISAVDHRDQLIEEVTKETGAAPRTVPQIWLDGKYVGGYTELEAHFKG
jgi:glutaredoxin